MSACQMITFVSLEIGSSFFAYLVHLEAIRIMFIYGHPVRVKVTGAKRCMQYGIFSYGRLNGVTTIFVT